MKKLFRRLARFSGKVYSRVFDRHTLKFVVPAEYKLLGVTPLTFTIGVLAQSNVSNFVIKKLTHNYVKVMIKNINTNEAISIAKECIFARGMVLQQAINCDLDITKFDSIFCVINSSIVAKDICRFFTKTGEVIVSNPSTFERLCVNRGVMEDDELC